MYIISETPWTVTPCCEPRLCSNETCKVQKRRICSLLRIRNAKEPSDLEAHEPVRVEDLHTRAQQQHLGFTSPTSYIHQQQIITTSVIVNVLTEP